MPRKEVGVRGHQVGVLPAAPALHVGASPRAHSAGSVARDMFASTFAVETLTLIRSVALGTW